MIPFYRSAFTLPTISLPLHAFIADHTEVVPQMRADTEVNPPAPQVWKIVRRQPARRSIVMCNTFSYSSQESRGRKCRIHRLLLIDQNRSVV